MKTKQFLKYTAIAFAGSVLLSACSSNVAETAAPVAEKETAKPAAKPLTEKEKRALADKEADALTKQFEAAVKEKEMAKIKPLRDQIFALDCNFNKKLHIAQRYAWTLFHAKDKAGSLITLPSSEVKRSLSIFNLISSISAFSFSEKPSRL